MDNAKVLESYGLRDVIIGEEVAEYEAVKFQTSSKIQLVKSYYFHGTYHYQIFIDGEKVKHDPGNPLSPALAKLLITYNFKYPEYIWRFISEIDNPIECLHISAPTKVPVMIHLVFGCDGQRFMLESSFTRHIKFIPSIEIICDLRFCCFFKFEFSQDIPMNPLISVIRGLTDEQILMARNYKLSDLIDVNMAELEFVNKHDIGTYSDKMDTRSEIVIHSKGINKFGHFTADEWEKHRKLKAEHVKDVDDVEIILNNRKQRFMLIIPDILFRSIDEIIAEISNRLVLLGRPMTYQSAINIDGDMEVMFDHIVFNGSKFIIKLLESFSDVSKSTRAAISETLYRYKSTYNFTSIPGKSYVSSDEIPLFDSRADTIINNVKTYATFIQLISPKWLQCDENISIDDIFTDFISLYPIEGRRNVKSVFTRYFPTYIPGFYLSKRTLCKI